MKILGIETSCDETAVCTIEATGEFGRDFSFQILGNALLSQTATHAPYGGVFPNLARREHEKNLVPLLTSTLSEAHMLTNHQGDTLVQSFAEILARENDLRPQLEVFLASYARPDIDAIAVTHGPGLEPALWVGVNFARALASAWQLPLVPVNHMEGHIVLSAMENGRLAQFTFPLLSLLISGGHTELILSREWMQYEPIGQTRDDAVGEAFDKVARLLDLPYPGGPEIERLAQEAREQNLDSLVVLPRPMIDSNDYDFSFAGLKTAVRRVVEEKNPLSEHEKCALAREFQDACADVLTAKTIRAIEEFGVETVLVGGGVSANEHIRSQLASSIKNYGLNTKLLIPPRELSTDNALMIALAGYFRALKKEFALTRQTESDSIRANGNLKLV